jgi:hypothetical protein
MNLNEYVKRVNDELTGVASNDISLILKTLIGVEVNVDITPNDVNMGSINKFDGPRTFRNDSDKIIRVSLETGLAHGGEVIFNYGRLYHGDEIQLAPDGGAILFHTEEVWNVQPLLVISFDDESFTPARVYEDHRSNQVTTGLLTGMEGSDILADLPVMAQLTADVWSVCKVFW